LGLERPMGKNNSAVIRAMKRSEHYKNLKEAVKSADEIIVAFKVPNNMKMLSWEGEKWMKMSAIDSIKYTFKLLHCWFIALDPKTGDKSE